MVVFRVLPFVAGAILICAVVYYAGKRMGLWALPNRRAGAHRAPVQANPALPARDPKAVRNSLLEDVRHEIRNKQADTWYLAARKNMMLRFYTLVRVERRDGVEVDVTVVCIEMMDSDEFLKRIEKEQVRVKLYEINAGEDGTVMRRTVLAPVIKPESLGPDAKYEIGRATDVAKGTPLTAEVTDDELRSLKYALRVSTSF
jgi:hypothetical protein